MTTSAPQTLVNRYQLADVLYRDGQVVAYHARDQVLNRAVTVELLHAVPQVNPQAAQQLVEKARRAALTSLPHIGAVYDQGVVDRRPFLVLEEALGPALREVAPLPPQQAANLVITLAETVRVAGERGQPLPTINEQTVRVAAENRVQILDLGLTQTPVPPTQGVRILGQLLQTALGSTNGAPFVTPLHGIAQGAVNGQYADVDQLVAELQRVEQRANSATTMMPRVHPTIDLGAHPSAQPAAAPAPTHVAAQAHVAPPVNAPAPSTNRRWLPWAALGLLAALLIGGFALRGSDNADSTSTPSAGQSAAPAGSTNSTPAGTSGGQPYVVAVRGNPPSIRVREGPGLNFKQVASLNNGTAMQVVGGPEAADNYNWVQIRTGNVQGWCILEGLRKQ